MIKLIDMILLAALSASLGYLVGGGSGIEYMKEKHLTQTTQQICERDLPRNEGCVQVWVKSNLD